MIAEEPPRRGAPNRGRATGALGDDEGQFTWRRERLGAFSGAARGSIARCTRYVLSVTHRESRNHGSEYGSTFDPILTLASSLDSIPGSHAALLGAGISIAAGVPSAWGVQEWLIRRLATLRDAPVPDHPHDWFAEQFGRDATYESLLEGLAPTPQDRQGILRGLFEPETLDPDAERPSPTAAHQALARLAAAGALRVFVTLNFDHLMEQALRNEGVEPTVVRTAADLAGLAPLHTLRAVVIHLHGDYLSPSSMRNTVDELAAYEPELVSFLGRLLSDHALLIVGWSAEYDPALRSVLQQSLLERFTSYWITRGQLGPLAADVATASRITHVRGVADVQLGRLADAHAALRDRHSRHILTMHDTVTAAKREIAAQPIAIQVHDRLRGELARLRDSPDLALTGLLRPEDAYDAVTMRLGEGALPAAALVAALAYWGNETMDRWWLTELPRFASGARGEGLVEYLSLPMYVGTLLYQSAAIGALASGRLDLLRRLFTTNVEPISGRTEGLSSRIAAAKGFGKERAPSAAAAALLRPIFVDHLAVGWRAYEEAWEMHDILLLTESLVTQPSFSERCASLKTARGAQRGAEERFQAAERTNDVDEYDEAQTARCTAFRAAGGALGALADLVRGEAHIRYSFGEPHYAPLANAIIHELDRDGQLHPLVSAGFGNGTYEELRFALEAVSLAMGRAGNRRALSRLTGGSGAPELYLWVDTGQIPEL